MTKYSMLLIAAIALLVTTAIGYRIGSGHWRPMPDTAATNTAGSPMQASAEKPARRIKYYRNPMGLPDTSPTPRQDSMGMDYIAVYDGEDEVDGTTVKVSLDKVQRAGVRSEPATLRHLSRPVRAPGTAKIDERTMRDVTLRADGFIEKLFVAELGKPVSAGEALFRVYSPGIVRAQIDYGTATRSKSGPKSDQTDTSVNIAVQRLRNLEVPESVIADISSGKDAAPRSIDWPAPVSGVVIDKKIVEGQKVTAGDLLYRLADLTKIWVIADVAEQDISQIKVGAPAEMAFRAFPGERFEGRVTFILHQLDMQTRTAKVRIEIANPELRIRGDMYADVSIETGSGDAMTLAVPNSALLETGSKQIVLLDKGDGRFEPRPVKIGMRGDGYIEIKDGLADGDKVVTTANFLIDSESNLKAALKSFTTDATAHDAMPMSENTATTHTGHLDPSMGGSRSTPIPETLP